MLMIVTEEPLFENLRSSTDIYVVKVELLWVPIIGYLRL